MEHWLIMQQAEKEDTLQYLMMVILKMLQSVTFTLSSWARWTYGYDWAQLIWAHYIYKFYDWYTMDGRKEELLSVLANEKKVVLDLKS
jgi:hypothetical protein